MIHVAESTASASLFTVYLFYTHNILCLKEPDVLYMRIVRRDNNDAGLGWPLPGMVWSCTC